MRAASFMVLAMLIALALPAGAQQYYCGVSAAALGAGPAASLGTLTGPAFDVAYMQSMYQQHADIASLASLGVNQASSRDVRDMSNKIRSEQLDQNNKISGWYQQATGTIPVANNARYQSLTAGLSCPNAAAFTTAYAQTMISLLNQSTQAENIAQVRAVNPDLRNQAAIASRSATNEIQALQRWLITPTAATGQPQVTLAQYYGRYNAPYYGQYSTPYYGRYYSPNYGGYYNPYYRPYVPPYGAGPYTGRYYAPYYGGYYGQYYNPYYGPYYSTPRSGFRIGIFFGG